MEKYKIYSKKEIKSLVNNYISPITFICIDDCAYPKEKFKQICINDKYIPYLISSYGRIFSINYRHRKNSCIKLKTKIDDDGYEFIVIHYDNISYGFEVYRMLANMFIENDDPINKTQVNHIDGNKINNYIFNLEWVTPKDNILHAWNNGLINSYGENNGNNVYCEDDIRRVCEFLEKDYTFKEISKFTGVSYAMISLIYRKKFWINISKKYDFSNYNYGRTRKIKNVIKICELLEKSGMSISKIAEDCSVNKSLVYDILRGHSFSSISLKYDFSKRKK